MSEQVEEMGGQYLAEGAENVVPEGYKLTEVGVIPEDWIISTLGPHAFFTTGPFGSALHKSDYVGGGIPVVNPMQIVNGKIFPTYSMAISESAAKKLKDFRLCKGDIVIGRRGDMGRCAVVTSIEDGWLCGTGSMIVRTKITADPNFLQLILASDPVVVAIENASVGTTMINLNQSTLRELNIALPANKQEQTAIATALSDIDALISEQEKLIAKKQAIKTATMQQLLTGRTRLPQFALREDGAVKGYKQSELGEVPEDWEVVELSEGVQLVSGHHVMAQYCNSKGAGVPYLTGPADFPNGKIIVSKYTEKPTSMCQRGDILITVKGSGAGSLIQSDDAYCISRQLMGIRSLEWNSWFLRFSILQNAVTIKSAVTGLIPGLSRSDILEQKLPIPSVEEQSAIANVLIQMGEELEFLLMRITKTRQIKQGMMQELLTGKTRLLKPEQLQ